MDLLVLPGTTKASLTEGRERAFSLLPHVESLRIHYPSASLQRLQSDHVVLSQDETLAQLSDYLKRTPNAQGAIVFLKTLTDKQFKQTLELSKESPLLLVVNSENARKIAKKDSGLRVIVDEEKAVQEATNRFIRELTQGS